MTQPASNQRSWLRYLGWGAAALVAGGAAWNWRQLEPLATSMMQPSHAPGSPWAEPLVELVPETPATLRLTEPKAAEILGLKVAEVKQAPRPEPLRLPGSLFLDPNRLVHVHSRFNGEVVSIGEAGEGELRRPLQYGDHVKKGQLLAVVWSKDIGEKKSELVDALSRLDISQALLKRLETLQKGVVTERVLLEARRAAEADMISVAKAERTLRSWRMTEEEIDAVRREYKNLQKHNVDGNAAMDRDWAQTDVRAAIDGVLVEKNFNVGDIIDPQDDLFKVADLRRMQVLANVYEEDLWAIRALDPADRRWTIDLKSDPADNQIAGVFELIGSVIDPAQRTGVVMGWLDNQDSKLLVGQFITATVELPQDPHVVAIPETALIEEGDSSTVFVETDAATRQYTRRKVSVVRRCAGTVYINSAPNESVAQPLKIGERVVVQGSLGLGGELANLEAANPHRG